MVAIPLPVTPSPTLALDDKGKSAAGVVGPLSKQKWELIEKTFPSTASARKCLGYCMKTACACGCAEKWSNRFPRYWHSAHFKFSPKAKRNQLVLDDGVEALTLKYRVFTTSTFLKVKTKKYCTANKILGCISPVFYIKLRQGKDCDIVREFDPSEVQECQSADWDIVLRIETQCVINKEPALMYRLACDDQDTGGLALVKDAEYNVSILFAREPVRRTFSLTGSPISNTNAQSATPKKMEQAPCSFKFVNTELYRNVQNIEPENTIEMLKRKASKEPKKKTATPKAPKSTAQTKTAADLSVPTFEILPDQTLAEIMHAKPVDASLTESADTTPKKRLRSSESKIDTKPSSIVGKRSCLSLTSSKTRSCSFTDLWTCINPSRPKRSKSISKAPAVQEEVRSDVNVDSDAGSNDEEDDSKETAKNEFVGSSDYIFKHDLDPTPINLFDNTEVKQEAQSEPVENFASTLDTVESSTIKDSSTTDATMDAVHFGKPEDIPAMKIEKPLRSHNSMEVSQDCMYANETTEIAEMALSMKELDVDIDFQSSNNMSDWNL